MYDNCFLQVTLASLTPSLRQSFLIHDSYSTLITVEHPRYSQTARPRSRHFFYHRSRHFFSPDRRNDRTVLWSRQTWLATKFNRTRSPFTAACCWTWGSSCAGGSFGCWLDSENLILAMASQTSSAHSVGLARNSVNGYHRESWILILSIETQCSYV